MLPGAHCSITGRNEIGGTFTLVSCRGLVAGKDNDAFGETPCVDEVKLSSLFMSQTKQFVHEDV